MNGFNLIRIPIDLKKLDRWAEERARARRSNAYVRIDRGRALHHLLTEVFGRQALYPFRLMVRPGHLNANLYAYTNKDREELREAAEHFALPDHLEVLGNDRILAKPMPTMWREGQRLGFEVQARPVRRVSRPFQTGQGGMVGVKRNAGSTELDAFLLAALRNPETRLSREEIYLGWLQERLDAAADLDRIASRLARFERVRVSRGDTMVEGPQALFHGVLTVNDPGRFARILRHGVGRHRTYGYGMLLLRPPKREHLVREQSGVSPDSLRKRG